jgi:predicted ester cyclase
MTRLLALDCQRPPIDVLIEREGFMTTERNKAVIRQFIEAVNRKDWRRFDELVSPDFVRHGSTFGQAEVRTRDQLRLYLVAEGDKVVAHSHCHAAQEGRLGTLPALGETLSADFISIYRLANGRIVEAWTEWDALNGLIQLGHIKPLAI